MRAVGFTEFGGPEVLQVLELPEPHPGPGQVRIKVVAADVNPSDTTYRSGVIAESDFGPDFFVLSDAYVVGWDAAGHIDEVGPGVEDFAVGDPVSAIVHPYKTGGAQAEYVVVPADSVMKTPDSADLIAWSTLPMNALTAQIALDDLKLSPGASVAVTGAAGAVGAYAVQLAKTRGLIVIADAADKDRPFVETLGADYVIRRENDFAEQVRGIFPDGADGVVDAAVLTDKVHAAVRTGATISSLRGQKGSTERGVHWAFPFVHNHSRNIRALAGLRDLAAAGKLTLRVGRTFTPEQAANAHQVLAQGGLRGRPVIVFDSGYPNPHPRA